MNGPQSVEVFESDTLRESLLTTIVLLGNDLNYHIIDAGIGNYYLYKKNSQSQSLLIKNMRCR